MSPENIKKAQKVLEDVMPDRNVTVTAYYMDMIDLYKDSRTFRDSVMIGGIVTLIIALIGLLGYTSDETNRRGREIAIRKVNGATAWSILKMISKDISYIAIPAIVIGMTVAYYSGMVGEIYGKGAHRIFHLPGRSDDGLCFDHCLCPVPCMGRFEF